MIQKSDGPDDPIFHTENPFNPQCVPGEIPTFDAHPTPIQEYQRPIHASLQPRRALLHDPTPWHFNDAFTTSNESYGTWNSSFMFSWRFPGFRLKGGTPKSKLSHF
jgi:hypothetical protein